ncbi:MAG: DUF106 domain-containing protein [Candidatus Woesearchaeota archaeon]|nr:MAG: DUF106 domain-containing protein [Candidatus Woesearchaeota archaeon]
MAHMLDFLFRPLLQLGIPFTLIVLTALLSIISTLATKYFTDQTKIKEHRKKIKAQQKKLKEARDDPKKAMKIQKEMMALQSELMKGSFRPVFITMIPFLLIFSWLNASVAYVPLMPDQEFPVVVEFVSGTTGNVGISSTPALFCDASSKEIVAPIEHDYLGKLKDHVIFTCKGELGTYDLKFSYNELSTTKQIKISDGQEYAPPLGKASSPFKRVLVGNEKTRPFASWGLPLTWFWSYFILVIAFSLLFKKILRVV